jgi:transposase
VLYFPLTGRLLERLQVWVDVLKMLDEKICQAKVGARCSIGIFIATVARSLVMAGMVPSEWSTGDSERRGSITKVGVPAIRRIIVEMVWQIVLFQPQ